MSKLLISGNGISLLKQFEGRRLTAYKAVATEKYYTIGYGHYGADVKVGMKISQAQAEIYLKADLKTFEDAVNSYVTVSITQNMFDALVSFTYNCGIGSLKSSTLLKQINAGNLIDAATEFAKWNKSGGNVLAGLTKRRAAEAELFLTGYCDKPTYQVSSTTATKAEVRWIQDKLGVTADGAWGAKTAAAVQAFRAKKGWTATSGYTATLNLIKTLAA